MVSLGGEKKKKSIFFSLTLISRAFTVANSSAYWEVAWESLKEGDFCVSY